MIEYRDHITRAMLKAEPDTLFVFGDNLARLGLGGQVKEMRGEPNAVGIPTKATPRMGDGAFFSDADFIQWANAAARDVLRLCLHQGTIVWPSAGIGTGLAQLEERAPLIWKSIEELRLLLEP